MSFGIPTTVNSAVSEAYEIAQELGLNVWQVQPGSYNGVRFYTTSVLSGLNSKFNPAAGVYSATQQFIGSSSLASTDNSSLPYGANITSTGITDKITRKLTIIRPPHNANGWESQGWNGATFSIEGIVFGANYNTPINNILNYYINDNLVLQQNSSNLYVLVHPILGTMQNVILHEIEFIHNPNLRKAALYRFIFESMSPPISINSTASNFISSINQYVTPIITITQALNNTWGDISSIAMMFNSSGNNVVLNQYLTDSAEAIKILTNSTIYLTQKLINNLGPVGYVNTSLNNITTTVPTNLTVYFFNSNLLPNNVYTLLELYAAAVDACLAILNIYNTDPIYDTVTNIVSLQSNLSELCLILLNSFYGNLKQYTVSFNTSIFNICKLNNINFTNQINNILLLNQDVITSTTWITQGTVLLLPINNNFQAVV